MAWTKAPDDQDSSPPTDDVTGVVERYAKDHGASLEEKVTILVLQGTERVELRVQYPGTFRPFPGTPPIISELTYSILDDEE
jgi:hypothetical protein